MGREHCVGSGGQVEPGQGCVVVGPEGPERLAHRASLAVAVGARSRESVAVPRAAKGWAQATSNVRVVSLAALYRSTPLEC